MSTQALKSFAFSVTDDAGNRRPASPEELAADLRHRFAGFVDLVTAADVPCVNNQACGTYPPDPLICDATTTACGQVLAIVLADEPRRAVDIAWWVQQHCVDYGPVVDDDGSARDPVLTLDAAIERGNFLPTMPFDIADIHTRRLRPDVGRRRPGRHRRRRVPRRRRHPPVACRTDALLHGDAVGGRLTRLRTGR